MRKAWPALLLGAAHATERASEPPQKPEAQGLRLEASQLRLSGFLDGVLAQDEKAYVAHPNSPASLLAKAIVAIDAPLPFIPGRWRVGVFADSQTLASGTGVRALAFVNNQEVGRPGDQHGIDVRAQHMRRRGLSLEGQWQWALSAKSDLTLAVKGKAFSVTDFKASQVQGVLAVGLTGNVGLQAQSREEALGGQSLFVPTQPTLGQGVAVDFALRWQDASGHHVEGSIRDFGPAAMLPSVLRTTQKANTQTVSFDSNGYLHFAPVLSGQYTNVPVEASYAPTWSVKGGWAFKPGWQLLAGATQTGAVDYQEVGFSVATATGHWRAQILSGSTLPLALELAWRHGPFQLAWQGDTLSPASARVWGFKAVVQF